LQSEVTQLKTKLRSTVGNSEKNSYQFRFDYSQYLKQH